MNESDITADDSGRHSDDDSEPSNIIANSASILNEEIDYSMPSKLSERQLPASAPNLAAALTRRPSLSRRSKLQNVQRKNSSRALLVSVVPAPNAFKTAENKILQQNQIHLNHNHHHHDAVPSKPTIIRNSEKIEIVHDSIAQDLSMEDATLSEQRVHDPISHASQTAFVNFPSRSRVRVLVKDEEQVTRISAGNNTKYSIFHNHRKTLSMDRGGGGAELLVDNYAVEDKVLTVSNPEYMPLIYELL